MGRTLKRVPMNFTWPKGKVWKGYLNPIRPFPCVVCKESGYSPEARALSDRWYGWDMEADYVWCDETRRRRWNRNAWHNNLDKDDVQALLEADRLWDFTRVPINDEQRQVVKDKIAQGENSWLPFDNGYIPTPEQVNEWNKQGLGHDSINAHIVIKAKIEKQLGLRLECAVCNGEGHLWTSPEQKETYDAWEPQEPPIGEGYQLWETTTEGSPQSPVFTTLDALCKWCARNATTFGSFTTSAKEWKQMLSEDFVSHQEGNIVFI